MRIRSKDGADFRVRIEYGGSGDPDLVGMGESGCVGWEGEGEVLVYSGLGRRGGVLSGYGS